MTRTRIRYRTDKLTGEVSSYEVTDAPRKRFGPDVMPDIVEFQSPLDYSAISSRSQLREHEKRHGVRQCGELKTAQDFSNRPDFGSNRVDTQWSDIDS